jgi:hypothetical protein
VYEFLGNRKPETILNGLRLISPQPRIAKPGGSRSGENAPIGIDLHECCAYVRDPLQCIEADRSRVAEYHQAAEVACGTGKASGAAVSAHAVFDAEVAAIDGDADSVATEEENSVARCSGRCCVFHGDMPF